MHKEIQIVIADDHPLMRKGLRLTIEEDACLKVVAEASDGEMAVALTARHCPHILLLDIQMPKLNGLEVAREINRQGIRTGIIFLTYHTSEDLFQRAMALGSMGYIVKDSAVEEVVAGIRTVAEGRLYVSSAITAELLKQREKVRHHAEQLPASRLTATEKRIMQMIAHGKTSKEIGAELSIHYRTVQNHRTNICRKLDLEAEGANTLLRFVLQNKSLP
jgi:DNA-binding NarL/FixJ family response regulator